MRLMLDIYSKNPWPSCQLSNFARAPFTLDGLHFTCMEGFLQSLKDPFCQEEYQYLSGQEAKERGSRIKWQQSGYLYWKGTSFRRKDRKTYRALLNRAYDAMFDANPASVEALLETGHCLLLHRAGRHFPSQTCLTTCEFLSLLYRARRLRRKQRSRKR